MIRIYNLKKIQLTFLLIISFGFSQWFGIEVEGVNRDYLLSFPRFIKFVG